MIQYITENGIIASIGHTDATYNEVLKAIAAGATHVTHLFNQMRGLHHREPGVVGAALLHNELVAEMIVDGVHVTPKMVEMAYKIKRKTGVILITDSIRVKCLGDGYYDLGGQDVTVKEGKAVLGGGTLAGSTLKMGQAVKNMLAYSNCTLTDLIQMVSANPAKQLKIFDRKGSITAGKDADIVILDNNMEIKMTICRGTVAFER